MYEKVLVPLDGSELAEKSLQYVKEPVAKLGAKVMLLHVCGPEECHCNSEKCTIQPMHRIYVEHATQTLRSELNMIGISEAEVGWEIVIGDPATEIIRYTAEKDVSLIMMATHGRSGVRRWVMGSVTDRVLRESSVPVRIVRAFDSEEAKHSDWSERKILVLLDGSNMAEQVLPCVVQHAEMSDRAVVLLQVCEPPDIDSPVSYYLLHGEYPSTTPLKWEDYAEQQMAKYEEQARNYLAGIEKRLEDKGVRAISEVLVGKPANKIVDYLSENSFNLIAMSTHGRSGLTRWAYGSVADRIIHAASSPILLVRTR